MKTQQNQRLKYVPAYARRSRRRIYRLTHQRGVVLPLASSPAYVRRVCTVFHGGFLRHS